MKLEQIKEKLEEKYHMISMKKKKEKEKLNENHPGRYSFNVDFEFQSSSDSELNESPEFRISGIRESK